ncbi:hypothetical protein B0H16DRAFT_1497015 [Mycena metata]|uniref:Uncharacterized protein n=1 Tax=Mycena metata TaxID=1033252 RepID=A0AAD7NYW3_9AGAR|nr:hypothetical protein B0H16DRAFT_1497015 [Mycena metata]
MAPAQLPASEEEPEPPARADDAELAELAAVLALSQAETMRQEKLEQKMLSQEEADFARAMEASMSNSIWSTSYTSGGGSHSVVAGSSSNTLTPMTSEFPEAAYMDDAAFAKLLAAQEEDEPTPTQTFFAPNGVTNSVPPPKNAEAPDKSAATGSVGSPSSDSSDLPVYSPRRPPAALQTALSADEEFARQIALEEEVLAREAKETPPPQDPPDLPSYPNGTNPPPIETESLEPPDLVRSRSTGTELTWVDPNDSPILVIDRPASAPVPSGRYSPENPRSISLRSEDGEGRPAPGPNQFLDNDILRGVSIGFVVPSITPELLPMQQTMPNIISLPYGRCPPLHLQAPSWRHLLKLMARLSGTRIEPTVEALAVTRSSQMNLRTVVQFVRMHQSSSDWRALLWFTIDHPVPASLPGARKYTNSDVDVLPWSYTLSSIPALLRDSSDTLLSKCYTIPSTAAVPFPALPITFPNMAMYLQAALEESRKYVNDSSSGMRKLAKMVETCYPVESNGEEGERSRVGGLFKKVIGRAGVRKDKSKKKGGGLNEDTYELVTPFVLDDWGP